MIVRATNVMVAEAEGIGSDAILATGNASATPQRVIETYGRPMRDVTADAVAALADADRAPEVYVRGGELVSVRRDEDDRPRIEQLGEDQLRGILERAAIFQRTTPKGGTVPVAPPRDIVRDLAALGAWPFRALEGITETPVLRADGTVLCEPGYDSRSRLIYLPASGLAIDVPLHPTDSERIAALALLDEMLGDFPFIDPASRANALGLLLTPIVRPAIRGQVPLALLDATKAGTGKGLLGSLVALIATGRPAAMLNAPTREEEWAKSLLAVLVRGSTFVMIDEVGELRSPALASALTATTVEGRLLGRSKTVQVPQRATWAAAGNNIRIGGDLARRCYAIRLDAKTARPWQRRDFRHLDLPAWATERRAELLAALLTLARAWYSEGCPAADVPPIGGFEQWARIVGGILAHARLEGFLANLDSFYEQADDESAEWEGFLAALLDRYRDKPFTVAELAEHLRSDQRLLDALPDDLADAFQKPPSSFKARLGKALGKRAETRYGDDGLHVERANQNARSGVASWHLQRDTHPAEIQRSHRSANPTRDEDQDTTTPRAHTSATSEPLRRQPEMAP